MPLDMRESMRELKERLHRGRAVPEGTLDNAPDWISTPAGTCMLP